MSIYQIVQNVIAEGPHMNDVKTGLPKEDYVLLDLARSIEGLLGDVEQSAASILRDAERYRLEIKERGMRVSEPSYLTSSALNSLDRAYAAMKAKREALVSLTFARYGSDAGKRVSEAA